MDKWITRQVVDLTEAAPRYLPTTPDVAQGSAGSMVWEVSVLKRGVPADLTGASIRAEIVRPDGKTVILTGTLDGSTARVVFDDSCCDIPGMIYGILWATDGSDEMLAIAWARWNVRRGATDVIVDPDSVIPSLQELLAEIADMRSATAAADEATEAANQAATHATTAAQSATDAAGAANTAAGSANTAADAAKDAAGVANSATDAAEKATEESRTATEAANTATDNANAATEAANTSEAARAQAEEQRVEAENAREEAEAARRASLGGLSFAINAEDGGLDITYTAENA